MRKIGVFICHCGINIAGTVDVEQVAEEIRHYPGVAFATTYKYTCSDPGQKIIKDAIQEYGLDGVIVAACSPAMHEMTFRRTAASAGMNPYLLECANIREQCSWVHQNDKTRATEKAFYTIQSMVEKVKRNEALDPLSLPLTKKAMVIGGGIAGITAALDIADAGYPVLLIEKSDHLGGKMADLSGTYLNFAAAPDLLKCRIDRVMNHPNIQVISGAEVAQADGYVGNFKVTVKRAGQGDILSHDVGAVIAATGYERYPHARLPEYGGGIIPDVIDALTFEAMLAPGAK
jgi:heterodisulfide reductase subunit A